MVADSPKLGAWSAAEKEPIAWEAVPTISPDLPGSPNTSGFLASLQGLRALACLLTLRCHMTDDRELMGVSGVSIFFVLSGYLISQRIIANVNKLTDEASVRSKRQQITAYCKAYLHFHCGRLVRIWPAALVVVGLSVWIMHLGQHQYRSTVSHNAIRAVLFLEDGLGDYNPFRNFWSLAVEISFYFLWSLLLPLLLITTAASSFRTHIRAAVMLSLIVISLVMRYLRIDWHTDATTWEDRLPFDAPTVPLLNLDWKFGFLPNSYKMLIGASLAMFDLGKLIKIPSMSTNAALLGLMSMAVGPDVLLHRFTNLLSARITSSTIMSQFQDPLVALFAALLLLCCVQVDKQHKESFLPTSYFGAFTDKSATIEPPKRKPLSMRMLESRAMVFVGRISYSCYLCQHPLLFLLGWPASSLQRLNITAVAMAVGAIITVMVEEPLRIHYQKRQGAVSHQKSVVVM